MREVRPLRLFLDTGVIIAGCTQPWGAAKALLILATQRDHFAIVLAEAVEREIQTVAKRQANRLPAEAATLRAAVDGWLARVRIERQRLPSPAELQHHTPLVLPAVRHVNDAVAVVSALLARPDWVISANDAHWNTALAERTGLRVATPNAFLRLLISAALGTL